MADWSSLIANCTEAEALEHLWSLRPKVYGNKPFADFKKWARWCTTKKYHLWIRSWQNEASFWSPVGLAWKLQTKLGCYVDCICVLSFFVVLLNKQTPYWLKIPAALDKSYKLRRKDFVLHSTSSDQFGVPATRCIDVCPACQNI